MTWFTKKIPSVVTQDRGVAVEIEQTGWISVKDKIPEFNCRVLVSCDFGVLTGHRTGESSEGHQWELGMLSRDPYSLYRMPQTTYKVTHWMPLPPGAA